MANTLTPISEIVDISDEFLVQYNALITQLSREPRSVAKDELIAVQERADSELLMCAFDEASNLVGITQATYASTPPMYRLYINNVVVDESQRGRGLGSKLMQTTMDVAQKKWPKIRRIVLTNNPRRGNAGFYKKLGFEERTEEAGNPTTVFTKEVDGNEVKS